MQIVSNADQSSGNPILDAKAWDLLEIRQIARQEQRVVRERDAGNLEVSRTSIVVGVIVLALTKVLACFCPVLLIAAGI